MATFLSVASVIWLGLFLTGLAYIIIFRLVASTGSRFVSLMNYLIPVMALAASTLILSEVLVGTVVIGLMFILSRTLKVRLLFILSP
jgi:drug/metabolite transporter (DMT)-like permease